MSAVGSHTPDAVSPSRQMRPDRNREMRIPPAPPA
jgi:hypothetical protein